MLCEKVYPTEIKAKKAVEIIHEAARCGVVRFISGPIKADKETLSEHSLTSPAGGFVVSFEILDELPEGKYRVERDKAYRALMKKLGINVLH